MDMLARFDVDRSVAYHMPVLDNLRTAWNSAQGKLLPARDGIDEDAPGTAGENRLLTGGMVAKSSRDVVPFVEPQGREDERTVF
jgi:hypothetical protein